MDGCAKIQDGWWRGWVEGLSRFSGTCRVYAAKQDPARPPVAKGIQTNRQHRQSIIVGVRYVEGPTRRVPEPCKGEKDKPREPRTQRATTGGLEVPGSVGSLSSKWKGTGVRHPQTPVRLHHRPLGDPPMTALESLRRRGLWSISNVTRLVTNRAPP